MLDVRKTHETDAAQLAEILNVIIAAGGTTAHMNRKSIPDFRAHYMDDPVFVHTVTDDGRPVGFQAVFDRKGGILSVGTFTDQARPVRGAGAALFEATKAEARLRRFRYIDAKIRADNKPGLAYYTKMGFEDMTRDIAVPLSDGTTVDRITKRFFL